MKLGAQPPRFDVRTKLFADYVARPMDISDLLAKMPPKLDWDDKLAAPLPDWGNNEYGDCGFAGLANALATFRSQRGLPGKTTTADVLTWYHDCTGFEENDPSTDQGVVLLDALNWARRTGLIFGYVKVDPHNLLHVRLAKFLFGGVYVGAALPASAQDTSSPWIGKPGSLDGSDGVGSWGGHCLWSARDCSYRTWGLQQPADDQWSLNYVQECYALLSTSWSDVTNPAPNHFAMAELIADVARI